jgi:hypothetical protein
MQILTSKTLLAIGIVSFVLAAGEIGYRLGKASNFGASRGSVTDGVSAVDHLASVAWSARTVEDGEAHPHYWRDWTFGFEAPDRILPGTAPMEPSPLFDALWPLSRQVMEGSGREQPRDIPFVIPISHDIPFLIAMKQ